MIRQPDTNLIIIIVLLLPCLVYGGSGLIWPLDEKPGITSTFCEFRPSHFHAGIDIRTYHKVGVPCLAVGDGVISYVRASPNGYGRALFLKLDDGRTAVYAHLQNFVSPLEEMVRLKQEETRDYSVRIWLAEEDKVRVKQGDVIAFSGRSGTTHPHLHFELRDKGGALLNPLLEGLPVPDDIKPVVNAVAIAPLSGNSTVEGDFQPRIYSDFSVRNGSYYIKDPIPVSGSVGISVKEYDKANEANNFLACYGIKLIANRDTLWAFNFDRFAFTKTRQIELERDYRLQRRGDGAFHRLYRMPGNTLDWIAGEGVITLSPSDTINVTVELTDAFNNLTTVELTLVSETEALSNSQNFGSPILNNNEKVALFDNYIRLAIPKSNRATILDSLNSYGEKLNFSNRNQSVASWNWSNSGFGEELTNFGKAIDIISPNTSVSYNLLLPKVKGEVRSLDGKFSATLFPSSLHDTMVVSIKQMNSADYSSENRLESVYQVEPYDQPLAGTIVIKIERESEGTIEPGWGVYYLDRRDNWSFLGVDTADGFYEGNSMSWETFGLIQDLDNPIIEVISPKHDEQFRTSKPIFHVSIEDKTSGISSNGMIMKIDGRNVPAEYDPPIKRLVYQPWFELAEGRHTFEIIVEDKVGNMSKIGRTFTIVK